MSGIFVMRFVGVPHEKTSATAMPQVNSPDSQRVREGGMAKWVARGEAPYRAGDKRLTRGQGVLATEWLGSVRSLMCSPGVTCSSSRGVSHSPVWMPRAMMVSLSTRLPVATDRRSTLRSGLTTRSGGPANLDCTAEDGTTATLVSLARVGATSIALTARSVHGATAGTQTVVEPIRSSAPFQGWNLEHAVA
jgi:hypothetical protein